MAMIKDILSDSKRAL